MIQVIINWIYIFVSAKTAGFLLGVLILKKWNYLIKRGTAYLGLGLVAVTVYAQFYSLFGGVSTFANLLFILLLVIGGGLLHRIYREEFSKVTIVVWKLTDFHILESSSSKIKYGNYFRIVLQYGVAVCLILLFSYATSRGIMHYDSDLYHGQSIRWIEEIGVAKGLANIHFRFAYNSSFFALSAFYSMKPFFSQSLHTVNGFLALMLMFEVVLGWKQSIGRIAKRGFALIDYARLAAVYYLFLIADEMISPASDYAIMCVIFYLVIVWLSLEEDEKEKKLNGQQDYKEPIRNAQMVVPYGLICLGGAFAVSVKLTAGLILILAVKPIFRLWKNGQKKQIFFYTFWGILIVLPWIIRTALISGYLLYPAAFLDVLPVEYKLEKAFVMHDAAEIKVWGRGLYDTNLIQTPIHVWFLNWFRTTLSTTEKLLVVLAIAGALWVIIKFVISGVIFLTKRKQSTFCNGELLVETAVTASFLFWLFSAPLIRYGYTYVLLMAFFFVKEVSGAMERVFCMRRRNRVAGCFLVSGLFAVLTLLTLTKGVSLTKSLIGMGKEPYYVCQKGYGTYKLKEKVINGVSFYFPMEGDQVGYDAFPAVPYEDEFFFRGKTLRDGFLKK